MAYEPYDPYWPMQSWTTPRLRETREYHYKLARRCLREARGLPENKRVVLLAQANVARDVARAARNQLVKRASERGRKGS